jgi:hypothetical protein
MQIKLIDSHELVIPVALNKAIANARGQYIVRLDAHSKPKLDYFERIVELPATGKFANGGGSWEIRPSSDSWIARGIAAAAAHTLGTRGARYRTGKPPGPVETVPFGAFERGWIEKAGKFEESLLSNEYYEFNLRLRNAGGEVFFDPRIRSIYIARATLRDLSRQYSRYGYWKGRILRNFPSSILLRQPLPPLFLISIIALAFLTPNIDFAGLLFSLELFVYVMTILFAAAVEAVRKRDFSMLFSIPITLVIMHFSWSAGFIWSGVRMLIGEARGE